MAERRKHLTFSARDFYKDYRKAARKSKYPVREWNEYRDYIYEFFAEVFKEILNGWHFVMPYSLGEFYLGKRKMYVGERIVRKWASMQAKKQKFAFNEHSFRYVFSFRWEKTYARFLGKKYYGFYILNGRPKQQRRYGVGKEAISKHIFECAEDPLKRLPNTIDKPLRKPQNIYDGSSTL